MKAAVGLAIGTDGIEVTLLSYLIPCVAADWGLSSLQEGSLTASVFGGELVGAILLGMMSDFYGRRSAFRVATILVLVFGVMTSFANGFWTLLLFRTLVGVGAGGMEVPFDLLGEIVTYKEKSQCVTVGSHDCGSRKAWYKFGADVTILVDVQSLWAVGSMFVGVAAWSVLSLGYSWRLLALVAAVPPFAVLCCFSFMPESPRWLIANGREAEAKEVLKKIARVNGVDLGHLTIVPEERPKGSGGDKGDVSDLWRRPELRSRTMISCVIWASFGFLYYGVILLSSQIMGSSSECSFDYSILFFASSSELVGNLLSRVYVDRIDRRLSLTINFTLSAVMVVLMPANIALAWLWLTSFCARGAAFVAASFSWVITPGLYPTEIRSTGHAVSNAFARLGAVGASYWVSSSTSNEGIAALLCGVGAVAGLTAQALPSDCRQEVDVHQTPPGVDQARAGGETTPLLHDPVRGTGASAKFLPAGADQLLDLDRGNLTVEM